MSESSPQERIDPTNATIPQRQYTKEEINRCYLRWQQLRNEHGENAPNVPEFIFFTKVLRLAAKQQQDLQQKRQMQQNAGEQAIEESLGELNGNSPNSNPNDIQRERIGQEQQVHPDAMNPSTNVIAQQMSGGSFQRSGNSNEASTPQNIKTMPSTNVNNSNQNQPRLPANMSRTNSVTNYPPSNENNTRPTDISSNGNPINNNSSIQQRGLKNDNVQSNRNNRNASNRNADMSRNPQHPKNIFTSQQSTLLKAQISALKCLVNQQSVPVEFQSIIQHSMNNPPDFRKMLTDLSQYVKTNNHNGANSSSNQQRKPSTQNMSPQAPTDKRTSSVKTEPKPSNPEQVPVADANNQDIAHENVTTSMEGATLQERVSGPAPKSEPVAENNPATEETKQPSDQIPQEHSNKDTTLDKPAHVKTDTEPLRNFEIETKPEEKPEAVPQPASPVFVGDKEPPKHAAPVLLSEFQQQNPTAI